ncbi:uncharacterized protein [Physcomitrium patens]|uniref:uncharacterized protein isoform X9 n=1 Tax=Physcomitrium patens TaxID=3218 RepID=UPI003CCE21E2
MKRVGERAHPRDLPSRPSSHVHLESTLEAPSLGYIADSNLLSSASNCKFQPYYSLQRCFVFLSK